MKFGCKLNTKIMKYLKNLLWLLNILKPRKKRFVHEFSLNRRYNMYSVWKFNINRDNKLALPVGAKVLSAGVQDSNFFIWAQIDTTEKEIEYRIFKIYGTGWDIENIDTLKFINTVYLNRMVFHVFEDIDK